MRNPRPSFYKASTAPTAAAHGQEAQGLPRGTSLTGRPWPLLIPGPSATPATGTLFLHRLHSFRVLLPKTRRGEGVPDQPSPLQDSSGQRRQGPDAAVPPASPHTGEDKRGLSQGGKKGGKGRATAPCELQKPPVLLLFILLFLLFFLLLPLRFRFFVLVVFDELLHFFLFEDSDGRLPVLSC